MNPNQAEGCLNQIDHGKRMEEHIYADGIRITLDYDQQSKKYIYRTAYAYSLESDTTETLSEAEATERILSYDYDYFQGLLS